MSLWIFALLKVVTFKYAYDGWLEAHSISFSSDNTLVKYETDYKPFFKGRDIESIDINLFNEENVKPPAILF